MIMPRTILSAAVILGLRYHSIIDAGRATGPRAMRMALLLVVCGLICWPTPSLAQNVKHTQNNLDQALRSDFRVDPTTLGLGFQLTLSGYPGRGGTSMPVTLSYSSKLWRM